MRRIPSDPTLVLPDGTTLPIEVRHHHRARRWSLRYDLAQDRVRLVMPPRASRTAALEWAAGQGQWVAGQRAKRDARILLVPGASIPFRGQDVTLVHHRAAPRRVVMDGTQLIAGGPDEGFGQRIQRWLRAAAKAQLTADSREVAAAAGVKISAVGVGDARTRWGSCSSDGKLRYSWRLILMPDAVRDYVVAHEIAHRRHMDHGREFHALEAQLYEGDVAKARALLRLWGERVRLIG